VVAVELGLGAFLLLSAVWAFLAGYLGGMGGRYVTLLNLRGELRAVADTVDPKAMAKLAEVERRMAELAGAQERTREEVKSHAGRLAQLGTPGKVKAEEMAFLVAAVAERVQREAGLKVAG
jgi:hypothetical protein